MLRSWYSFHFPLCKRVIFTFLNVCFNKYQTERCNLVVITPASLSGGLSFESVPGNRLSGLMFLWFSSVHRGKLRGHCLKLGHNLFFPHPFQFINNLSPFIRRYMDWFTENEQLNKLQADSNIGVESRKNNCNRTRVSRLVCRLVMSVVRWIKVPRAKW